MPARPAEARPRAWFTYHAYHKSPDWLGPAVTAALGLPYLLAETSFAPKQEGGAWALGHAAAERAIRAADVILALTRRSMPNAWRRWWPAPARCRRLPPFIDPAPGRTARQERERHRAALARRFALDPQQPWLLTVAMMRADVKRDSYGLLAHALAQLRDLRWQLLVVGDGPARSEVAAMLRVLGDDRGPARRPAPGGSRCRRCTPRPTCTSGRRCARPMVWPCSKPRPPGCRWWPGRAVGWRRWSPMAEVAC